MLTLMFENLSEFPRWLQILLLGAWGGLLIAIPICLIIKIMQSPTMRAFFKSTPPILKKTGDYLQYQIDDPIKFPKIQRALEYMFVVISYLVACLLFLNFIVLVLLWAAEVKKFSIFQQAGVVGYSLFCAYWAAVLKTQGSRTLLKLRGN